MRILKVLLAFMVVLSAESAMGQYVVPILECVQYDSATNQYTALFGYFNPADAPITITAGSSENFFTPGNPVRGQPSVFQVGVHRNVFSVSNAADRSLIWVLGNQFVIATNDPAFYCDQTCTPVPGPSGPEGAPGPQGEPGAAGAVGATGAQGPPGPIGPAGATGPKGDVGPAGATGATGPEGPQGEIGPAGPQGAVGPQGESGPAGEAGEKGERGSQGPTGATGPAGERGERGPAGPIGPAGPEGPAGAAGRNGIDGRLVTRTASSADSLQLAAGQHEVVTLTVTTDEPMTLVLFATVSTASQKVRMSLAVGDDPLAPAFDAELDGARLPISMHGRTTISRGTHRIAVRLESEGTIEVGERLLTAMLFREMP